ncbi:MAG: ECF transporter S component [Candidatus Omnitrophica bacterium]|nr:ECF transporter S component [Candidatus Omnitrophota bacterium]
MFGLGLMVGALLLLGVSMWTFERSRLSSKEIALLVVLAAVASVGRVVFAAIPSVQPVTCLVLLTGLVFGPLEGLLVGAASAWLSNCVLGQGPWTLWQMVAWGLAGGSAGWVGRWRPASGRWTLTSLGWVWGYLFGWIMNLWYWAAFVQPHTWPSWLLVNAGSFGFDTAHAVGNVVFALLLGGDLLTMLRRFHRKLLATTAPALL